jgi:UDP-N-acetyl-D-mannosaminuronic acid transferase (WecB/TagA/CpsF family)
MREIFIFGIRFLDGKFNDIFKEIEKGGVMVAPAAPALANINCDKNYYEALKESRFAIFDSGLLCITLFLIKGIKVKKMSGLAFIRSFMEIIHKLSDGEIFMIDPTEYDSVANRALCRKYNYNLSKKYQYLAPFYSDNHITDNVLLERLSALKPKYIVINLGGGTQEKLGSYLEKNILSYKPTIICTGAAIAFLSGSQANIPVLIDRLSLGWLYRCLKNPGKFVPRYIQGIKIIPMILNKNSIG